MRNQFEVVLGQWGKRIGIERLGFAEDGFCTLEIDDVVVTIGFLDDIDEIILFSELGRIDIPLPIQIAKILLAANAKHSSTNGSALGVDAGGSVTLTRQADAGGIDQLALERLLERFVDTAHVWKANCDSIASLDVEPEPVSAADGWLRA